MFIRILEWLQGVIYKMLNTNNQVTNALQQQVGITYNISQAMQTALNTWSLMYANQADWLISDIKSANLSAQIAGEIARTATIEMEVEITGSARALWLHEQMERVTDKLRTYVEYGNAKGGLMFKPYVDKSGLCIDYVQADMFYPLAFDSNGQITAVVFAERLKFGNYWYTRFESHQLLEGGQYRIKHAAYRSDSQNYLGTPCNLTAVQQWADLEPEQVLEGIERPLYSYYRYPSANNIDSASPLGISCYARAVDLIKEYDYQWTRFLWEFQSGERALYVDKSAFILDSNNQPILPSKKLYRVLNVAPASINEPGFFKDWSPTLRDQAMLAGLDALLRKIEFACGMSYGVLSNPQAQALTATEIKNSQQRYYATVTDVQKAIEESLEGLVYAMDVYATLYNLAPAGTYDAAYSFDDSIVADHDTQFTQDTVALDKGAMSRIEWRMRTYGETEEIAREKLALVSEENTNTFVARINAVRQ